jgi:hypothetical protein
LERAMARANAARSRAVTRERAGICSDCRVNVAREHPDS